MNVHFLAISEILNDVVRSVKKKGDWKVLVVDTLGEYLLITV